MMSAAWQQELQRQQALVQALFQTQPGTEPDPRLQPWEQGAAWQAGLAAYRGNGLEHARAALRTLFPTLMAMLGQDAFDAVCARYWHALPPRVGDLARIGERLPDFVALQPELQPWPWLGDSARLDLALWAVLFDAPAALSPIDLQRLAENDPATLRLRLAPGTRRIDSPWPIVTLWQLHREPQPQAEALRAACSRGTETAWVWRDALQSHCLAADEPHARWLRALAEAPTLAAALDVLPDDFDLSAWLHQAAMQGWIAAVESINPSLDPRRLS